MFLFKCLYLFIVSTGNAAQRERVEVVMAAVGVGRAGEEGGEFLVDDGGQAVALKRLHEPHAEDALVLAGYDPQRIGIGAGTDAHGLHLPGDGVAALMVREDQRKS